MEGPTGRTTGNVFELSVQLERPRIRLKGAFLPLFADVPIFPCVHSFHVNRQISRLKTLRVHSTNLRLLCQQKRIIYSSSVKRAVKRGIKVAYLSGLVHVVFVLFPVGVDWIYRVGSHEKIVDKRRDISRTGAATIIGYGQ